MITHTRFSTSALLNLPWISHFIVRRILKRLHAPLGYGVRGKWKFQQELFMKLRKPFDSCRIFGPAAFHTPWCSLTSTTVNQFSYEREFSALLTRHQRRIQLFQWSVRRPRFTGRFHDKNYKGRPICTHIEHASYLTLWVEKYFNNLLDYFAEIFSNTELYIRFRAHCFCIILNR